MHTFTFIKKGGCLLAVFFGMPLIIFAQVQSVGRAVSFNKIPGGISGKTANAIFDVHVYNDNIIRVRVSRHAAFSNFSYALEDTAIPIHANVEIQVHGENITLSTTAITADIETAPELLFTFKDKAGNIINSDVPGQGFGTSFTGDKVSVYKKLQDGERFVGLGEVLGNLDKRGQGFTLDNTDNYRYGDTRVSMYGSVPFFMGIHHQKVYGLFFHNTYKTFFNFGLSTPYYYSINAEGGDADYFFIYDSTPAKILQHYTALTGHMPLPPLWSIGYHQSRCSYYPQSKVLDIARMFRSKGIPLDCMVLDADYLHEYEPFRINTNRFPDMAGMTAELKNMGIEVTASVNPGIKIDTTYTASLDAAKNDVLLKYSDGSYFISDIPPSRNRFVDFTLAEGRKWWINKMKFLPDNGIHGYWNDMNEPAVSGSYLPPNVVFGFDGHKTGALEAKNVYGMQMARSSFESALKYGEGRRPFILTRSFFAGVQRYSAVWSGDNMATNEGLLSGVLLNNQLGLSGIPFVGPDLGGYIGDGNKDLFRRWIQVGIFSPFLRNHREFFGAANEPWAYGEETEAISKTNIQFRYRLLPYIYAAFYEASQTGMPIVRSLCIQYPYDNRVYDPNYQYEFTFGDALLVVPVTPAEKYKKFFLPNDTWYDMYTDERIEGNREVLQELSSWKIPVFVKASSVIPMQSSIQSTKQKPSDTLYLHVYNGTNAGAFTYYEDDGNTFDYKKGNYCKRIIRFNPAVKQITLSAQQGSYPSQFKIIQLVLHGFEEIQNVTGNNTQTTLESCREKILNGLEYLEDYYDADYYKTCQQAEVMKPQQTVYFTNNTDEIVISWQ
ncbi:MAG TPA: TIM-barrel domain-containing protein [Chitinophagaceae bacterium]|nr:TIM-barrel domain-containing protein [Chitinophagaceae bacterium]